MIRQSYDLDAKALYITVREAAIDRTEEIDSGTMVDLDAAGDIVGIEVINPDRNWPLEEIIGRYRLPARAAAELRAYFPRPGVTEQTESPTQGSPKRSWPVFGGTIETCPA